MESPNRVGHLWEVRQKLADAWDCVSPPEAADMVGFPGGEGKNDEFVDCFNVYAGKTWRAVAEVETSPNYAAITLMNDPEKAYYLGAQMVRTIDEEVVDDKYFVDRVDLVFAAIEGITRRKNMHIVFSAKQIEAIEAWELLYIEEKIGDQGLGW